MRKRTFLAELSTDSVVVLDRSEPGDPLPDYCVHGRTTCIGCNEWVWLGNKTLDVVASGKAAPLCRQCAIRQMPPDLRPYDHVTDNRRADGPHA
jgi:hypothetical protein